MLNFVEFNSTAKPITGPALNPIFDDKGLIPCVAQDAETKQVLLFEWMDRRAFERTISTGLAHYFVQHRKGVWRRYPRPAGRYPVREMLLNEEQNCLLLVVDVPKKDSPAHVSTSSFHREFDWQD
jgi:phosphoribosyl-AMP cyclohydrolase